MRAHIVFVLAPGRRNLRAAPAIVLLEALA
jgi:hypothetical protein